MEKMRVEWLQDIFVFLHRHSVSSSTAATFHHLATSKKTFPTAVPFRSTLKPCYPLDYIRLLPISEHNATLSTEIETIKVKVQIIYPESAIRFQDNRIGIFCVSLICCGDVEKGDYANFKSSGFPMFIKIFFDVLPPTQ